MTRGTTLRAILPTLVALAGLITTRANAQTTPSPMPPQTAATATAPQAAPPASATRSALDSACVARALPITGSAIFAGLREAIGEARSWTAPPPLPPRAATIRALKLALGWSAILYVLGIGVLVFAPNHLRKITEQIGRDPLSSLMTGLLADIATIPVLLAVVVLLTITILGILLVPFAIVAYVLMLIGIYALGFFSVAQMTGLWLLGDNRSQMTQRGAALAGLLLGLGVYLLPWIAAAAMTWSTTPAIILRVIAVAVTAVGITAGLGAVIRSYRDAAAPETPDVPVPRRSEPEPMAWQTPTPVGGVVAARRTAG